MLLAALLAACGARTGLDCEAIGARCPDPPPRPNKAICQCDSCVFVGDVRWCSVGRELRVELCIEEGSDADAFCRTDAPAMLEAAYDFASGRAGLGHSCATFECEAAEAPVFNETCPHRPAPGLLGPEVCAPERCSAGSCRVVGGVGVCECNVVDDCDGRTAPLACTPAIGSGDPPVSHTGPLTHALAVTNAIDIDASTSTIALTSCFEFLGTHCASATAGVRGDVRLYGYPEADGSGDFQLDFGLFIEDMTLDFGFIAFLGNVVVNVTDIYAMGGGGPTRLHVDSAGRGAVPMGAMVLTVHAVQDGTEILVLDAPVSRDVPLEVDFARRTFRLPRLDFSFDGVSGQISLDGAIVSQPPVARAGPDSTVECTAPDGATVVLDGTGSTDPDGDLRQFTWFSGPAFGASSPAVGLEPTAAVLQPVGAADYDLVISDARGQLAVDQVHVEVRDTTPPALGVSASPSCLFPPNHRWALYEIGAGLNVEATDACDPSAPDVRIVDVRSSQPALGGGSGHTDPDVVLGERALCIRAERAGTIEADRVYTVTLEATDSAGNVSVEEVVIRVPHDRSGDPPGECRAVDPARTVALDDVRCRE